MFAEILNPFLNVRNKIKKNGLWVDKEVYQEKQFMVSGVNIDVESGSSWRVLNSFGRHIIIDYLEFGTLGSGLHPQLYSINTESNYQGNLFHVVNELGRTNATPGELLENGSSFLECKPVGDGWVIDTKKQIILPEGCRLFFRNIGSSTTNVTYKVYYREVFNN